jgi:hypothetical protein
MLDSGDELQAQGHGSSFVKQAIGSGDGWRGTFVPRGLVRFDWTSLTQFDMRRFQ